MNFLKNCTNPRKLYTSLAVLGAGHFCTASILFGFTNAPAMFMRTMSNLFSDLPDRGVVAFMDDVLIYIALLLKSMSYY